MQATYRSSDLGCVAFEEGFKYDEEEKEDAARLALRKGFRAHAREIVMLAVALLTWSAIVAQPPQPAKLYELKLPAVSVECVGFDSAGKRLAVGCRGGRVVVIDVATKSVVMDIVHPSKGDIRSVHFLEEDKNLLLAGQGKLMSIWSLAQKKEVGAFEVGHSPFCGQLSRDKTRFVAGAGDGFCSIWDLKKRKEDQVLNLDKWVVSAIFGLGGALDCVGLLY